MEYLSEKLTGRQIRKIKIDQGVKLPKKRNSLYKEIKEIVYLGYEYEKQGIDSFKFNSPAMEEEMAEWEADNQVKLPEEFKDWLRFSHGLYINYPFFHIFKLKEFEFNAQGGFSPDWVVIGSLVGDGERLCFSRTTGKIVRYFEGQIRWYDDFQMFLYEEIESLKGCIRI